MKSEPSQSVALATSTYFPDVGGTEVTLHNLALELQKRGHRPVVIARFGNWKEFLPDRDSVPYPVIPLFPVQHAGLLRFRRGYQQLQNLYLEVLQQRYQFDVWQSFGTFPAGVSVAEFTATKGLPHVIRTGGEDIQINEELNYGIRMNPDIERLICSYAVSCDRIIALTESVVPDCMDIGMERGEVAVIPNALDLERFQRIEADADTLHEQHGIPSEPFTFVTVGRNHPKKGFKHLLEALAILTKQGFNCHVVFIGSGMSPIAEKAQEMGIRDRVTFTGEIAPSDSAGDYQLPPDGVIRMYKMADAVAFPSLLETFGHVNIEAMAVERPIVSTDAPGCRDIVDHEINGLIAPAGEAGSLADQMQRIVESPELRSRLVKNGLRTVCEQYTWETVGDQYLQLYREIV